MNSFFNIQFGEFNESSPNWFDWFSLIINIIVSAASILLAFYLAERIYKKEKKDKEKDNLDLLNSEVDLFENSLIELNVAIKSQIKDLEEYVEQKNFSLKFHPDIQVDFLQFIDVKFLYKKEGLQNSESIQKTNRLLTNLYTLYDFRKSLRDELRTYIKKYNYHESKFYLYRMLLHTKYFELCNKRNIDVKIEQGIKKWSFNDDDNFMKSYTSLINKTLADEEIMSGGSLISREELTKKFIIPLAKISYEHMPEDYNAIEVNEIANQVIAAHRDMEEVTEKHFNAINSYLTNLNIITKNIEAYLPNIQTI
ncbi:hypothetical protein FUA48_02145 [Flavobacterium alkalisoli]|uniref:Phage abortive infection protein n=1 Tax=Flavobacterium alkalisoli TaxID=2602769 RepID=A0A5B9FUL7_9FLAO|nr:hypothetical protein [Flavobacterium alkalisoli]QEE48417.1 hypothetical protein FUA48_02145 [Flavobacterium alkalisoli]